MKRLIKAITYENDNKFTQVLHDLSTRYKVISSLPQIEGPLIGDSWIFKLRNKEYSNIYRLIIQYDGYECRMILQICEYATYYNNELVVDDPVDYRDDVIYFKDYLTVLNNWVKENEAEDPNFTQYE